MMKHYHSYLKKFLSTLFGLLIVGSLVQAETPDDVQAIQQAQWQVHKINDDVVLKRAQFPSLFGTPQNISFLEVDLNGKKLRLGVAADAQKRILTSDFARRQNAIAAINGTFFNMKEGGAHMLVKVGGKVVNPTKERSQRTGGAVAIEGDTVTIVPANPDDVEWETKLTASDVMVSGPLLLTKNQPAPLAPVKFNMAAHPRSAVGLTTDNKLLLVTVDGRQEKAGGVSLISLTTLMQALGATDALNLDGGGSTTLYVKGVTENGIVNSPSDKAGERTVANALLLLAE